MIGLMIIGGGFFLGAFLNLLYLLYMHLSYLVFGGKFPVYWIRKESLEREWCVASCGVLYRYRTTFHHLEICLTLVLYIKLNFFSVVSRGKAP